MFYRWHPQLALRYLPIVKFINSLKINNPKILEVGSGSLGIGPYIRHEITGLDIDFSGPRWPKMKQVKGSANKLPFTEDEFDIAISVDVIEHLPKKIRQKSIEELFRVASLAIIIAAPIGNMSQAQDRDLSYIYDKKFGKQFPFLKEHLRHGLPEKDQLTSWIKDAANINDKRVIIHTQGNRNLKLRMWLMKGWMAKNKLIDLYFRKVLLLFLPILRLLDIPGPHYRQIFFVTIKNKTAGNPSKYSAQKTAE